MDYVDRATYIEHITSLQGDIRRLQAGLEDVNITVNSHTSVLRYAPLQCSCADDHTHLPNIPLSTYRNHASTMMCEREIQADFVSNNRGDAYSSAGGCLHAANAATKFFNDTHYTMCPRTVQAVLYSASDAPLKTAVGTFPDKDTFVLPNMKRYTRRGACTWVLDDHPVAEKVEGYKHYVCCVSLADEDERVVVDWGIHQFPTLPEDIHLYLIE